MFVCIQRGLFCVTIPFILYRPLFCITSPCCLSSLTATYRFTQRKPYPGPRRRRHSWPPLHSPISVDSITQKPHDTHFLIPPNSIPTVTLPSALQVSLSLVIPIYLPPLKDKYSPVSPAKCVHHTKLQHLQYYSLLISY